MADFCCCHVIALSSYKQISLGLAHIWALKRHGNDEEIELIDILVSPTGIEPVSHA